jgi:hypothetical protein
MLDAGCAKNAAASCSERHRSADGSLAARPGAAGGPGWRTSAAGTPAPGGHERAGAAAGTWRPGSGARGPPEQDDGEGEGDEDAAAELGAAAMTLYYYVRNKTDIVALMQDTIIEFK